MKKLICALVLLAMLVPVAAMAAVNIPAQLTLKKIHEESLKEAPQYEWSKVSFDSDGTFNYTFEETPEKSLTARYYAGTGQLREFGYTIKECGCYISYTPTGTPTEIIKTGQGMPGLWNFVAKKWYALFDSELELSGGHNPIDEHTFPFEAKSFSFVIPPETISVDMDLFRNGLYTGDVNQNDVTHTENKQADGPSSYSYEITFDSAPDCDVVLYNNVELVKDVSNPCLYSGTGNSYNSRFMLALIKFLENNESVVTLFYKGSNSDENDPVEKYVFMGAQSLIDDGNTVKLEGHPDYYLGRYTTEGIRKEYGIRSKDYKSITSYDNYNRMTSHEVWDEELNYWLYEKGQWTMNPFGAGESGLENMIRETPSAWILKSLNRTTLEPEYDISTSGHSEAGLPSIQDNGSLNGAKVSVINKLVDEHTTEYNIIPEDASGKPVIPSNPVKQILPLPAGMDVSVAKNSDIVGKIVVLHDLNESGSEKEAFSVDTDTMKITAQGLEMMATSYSPYTVIWGAEAEEAIEKYPAAQVKLTGENTLNADIPSTGDSSNLLAYACLLLASAAMFVMLRRRAHQ